MEKVLPMGQSCALHTQELSELETKIKEMNGEITDLKLQMATMKEGKASREELYKLKDEISILKDTVFELKVALKSLQETLYDIKSDSKEYADNIKDLTKELVKIQSRLDGLETWITEVQVITQKFDQFLSLSFSYKMGKAFRALGDAVNTFKSKGRVFKWIYNIVLSFVIAFFLLSTISIGMYIFDKTITVDFDKLIEFVKAFRG